MQQSRQNQRARLSQVASQFLRSVKRSSRHARILLARASARVDRPSTNHSEFCRQILDGIFFDGQRIAGETNEVGELAVLDRTLLVLFERQVGTVDGGGA